MSASKTTARRMKLTNAVIAKYLIPPTEGISQTTIYDTEVIGFGAYRTSEKPGKYFCQFRIGGRQRKKTIAPVTEMSVADARDEAITLKTAPAEAKTLSMNANWRGKEVLR